MCLLGCRGRLAILCLPDAFGVVPLWQDVCRCQHLMFAFVNIFEKFFN